MKEYALYKGEECLHIGTAKEIAQTKNIKVESVYYLNTPAYRRKLERRKFPRDAMILVELGKVEEGGEEEMIKTCNNCYYFKDNYCSILKGRIDGCWADEEEALKRAKAIKDYASMEMFQEDAKVHKKSVKEKLDESFKNLYDKGMNDLEIAKKLGVSEASTRDYRYKMDLPAHKKRRTAGTGAAKAK